MLYTVTAAASHDPDGPDAGPALRPVQDGDGQVLGATRRRGSGHRPAINLLSGQAAG